MKRLFSRATAFIACAAILLAVLTATACDGVPKDASPTPKNRIYYDYFDTVSVIYDYTGSSNNEFDALCADIEDELDICHRLFDIYHEYEGLTNLKTVNNSAGKGPIKVDGRIIDLLETSVELYGLTDGNVNVMMGAVLSIWHEHRSEGISVPDMETLVAANGHTSIKNLVIDRENMTVEITDPEASLDVGAIAKGYAAERIHDLIASRGLEGYAINLGGNLRVVGTKPNGDGWVSGIQNPDKNATDPYVDKITISASSLVTSGVYERFYVVDGVEYHHIINKDTLMPERNYLSVSIHTESSTVADALSTALFNMSVDEGRAVISSIPGTEVVYVLSSGEVVKIKS